MDYTINRIKDAVKSGAGPDVVLLQEICLHQLWYVGSQLREYELAFAQKRLDFRESPGPSVGCLGVTKAEAAVAGKTPNAT